MLKATEVYDRHELVNISSGTETSIREVVEQLQALTGFAGEITWNTERSDGQLRRLFDISKARRDLQFEAITDLARGLKNRVAWYQETLDNPAVRR